MPLTLLTALICISPFIVLGINSVIVPLLNRKRCPVCRTRCPDDYHFCPNCRYEYRATQRRFARLEPSRWLWYIGAFLAGMGLCGGVSLGLTAQMTYVGGAENMPTPLPTPTQVPLSYVVMAIQQIPRGTILGENAVGTTLILSELRPADAFSDMSDVMGKVALQDIYREMPITSDMLLNSGPTPQPMNVSPDYQPITLVLDQLVRDYPGAPPETDPTTLLAQEERYNDRSESFILERNSWGVEGVITGAEGQHMRFDVSPDGWTSTLAFSPALVLWHESTEQLIPGEYTRFRDGSASLSVSLPEDGVYLLSIFNTKMLTTGAVRGGRYLIRVWVEQ